MDLVYKIGLKCEWENYNELRYSIRSAVKHVLDLEKIVIVGYKPYWLTNVLHIQAADPYLSNKDGNLINKMIIASMHPEVTKQFLNMSDDNYFLADTNIKFFLEPIYNNKMIDFKPEQRLTRWEERLLRTIHLLQSKSLPVNCYEAHTPYLLNKEDYATTLFKYDYGFDNGLTGNTLYFNTNNRTGKPIRGNDLVRIETFPQDHGIVPSMCASKLLLNYTTKSFNEHIKTYLQQRFSDKSIYEND